jgi:hypothetical protein
LYVVGSKLIVGDALNNRVLIWNTVPSSHGQPADLVLGQADFTGCATNRGGTVAADTQDYPAGIWSDGARLIVADQGNHRVLIWNSFPTANGQPADLVLGQPDMASNLLATSTSNKDLDYPYFVFSNGNQLFLADVTKNRVLIWDSIPTTNYAAADRVIGQPDFVTAAPGVTETAMTRPAGVYALGNKLIVTDTNNHRYLIFQAP